MTIIVPSNFKGGVGKTTTSLLMSYLLAVHHDKSVLAIDTDPQENLTFNLSTTFGVELDKEKNIFNACFGNDETSEHIQKIHENMDIIAGAWKMTEFELSASNIYKKSAYINILKYTIESIKDDYDYVFIDTSPYINLVMDNVINVADYVLITTQTVPNAFESTKRYYDYLLDFYETMNFELIGVLPYLVGLSATDKKYLSLYDDVFENELFSHHIRNSDRVKTWSAVGITTDKPYDKVTLSMYDDVLKEMIERINQFENQK